MSKENYKRYGFGGPKKIVDPKWVKDLCEDDSKWTMEQQEKYFNYCSYMAAEDTLRRNGKKSMKSVAG